MNLLWLLPMLSATMTDVVQETAYKVDPAIFDCAPSHVSEGQYIIFTKSVTAYDELLVVTPRGTTGHFLVVDGPPEEMQPLMSTQELAQAKSFTIEVSSLHGLEWRKGALSEKIFQEAGLYQFQTSTKLESEEGGYACTVEYIP